jgi:hypothetical protein
MGKNLLCWLVGAAFTLCLSAGANATEVIIPGLKDATSAPCVSSPASCAADNYAILNHRLNYATGSDKSFIIPSGVYYVPSLAISADASLRGAGPGVTTLKYVAVGGHAPAAVLAISSTQARSTVSVSDLTLDGAGLVDGVTIKDTDRTRIDHVLIVNVHWGLKILENNVGLSASNISIQNAQSESLFGGVLIGEYTAPPTVTQSNIDIFLDTIQITGDYDPASHPTSTCSYGVLIQGGTSGVYGNKVSAVRCRTGFTSAIYPGTTDPWVVPEWIFCTDCIMDTIKETGWLFSAARGVTLDGSWSGTSGQAGIVLGHVSAATITGMKSFNHGAEGLRIEESSKEIVIANGLFELNARTSIQKDGIYTAGDGVVLRNNIISNAANVVSTEPPQTLQCGIRAKTGATLGASNSDNLIRNATNAVCLFS